MIVLSLFDGISCGRVALGRSGIQVSEYYASEIDKHAINISSKNYPDIKQLGDILKWESWEVDWSSVGLILAGFPCQAWSLAGKGKGDKDPRGALVHTLIELLNTVQDFNPDVKFLFENVKMKAEHIDFISELFGTKPLNLNSNLVSAQNRDRYYWTNIPYAKDPNPKDIDLVDILECTKPYIKINKNNGIKRAQNKASCLTAGGNSGGNHSDMDLLEVDACNCETCIKNKKNPHNILANKTYRRLSILEWERLQTLAEGYTEGVSSTQRYKAVGNAWTVDIIAHILKGLNNANL